MTLSRTVVVSYWNGILPVNSRLHFETFFTLNPQVRYHLYIEKCDASSVSFLQTYVESGQLEIKETVVGEMLHRAGAPLIHPANRLDLLLAIPFKIFGILFQVLHRAGVLNRPQTIFREWFHCELGFSPPHWSRLSNYKNDYAYLSDLFRCMVASDYADCDFWYFDLDVAFMKPLDELAQKVRGAFVSQWGLSNFGNSAIMFIPKDDAGLRLKLISEVKAGVSAKPWVMFSASRCEEYRVTLLGCQFTDPPWSPSNPFYANSARFFESPPLTEAEWSELGEHYLFHWHGMWSKFPHHDSPYFQLLSRTSRVAPESQRMEKSD